MKRLSVNGEILIKSNDIKEKKDYLKFKIIFSCIKMINKLDLKMLGVKIEACRDT